MKEPAPPLPDIQPTDQTPNSFSSFRNKLNRFLGRRIELSDTAASKKDIADLVMGALPDKLLQFGIEQTLQPVIELAKKSSSYNELKVGLAALYPKMNTNQIEELLTKVMFIAETEGKVKASLGK